MHTPLWIKIGMGLGFAYIGIYGINVAGNMFGGKSGGHGEETHVASTEHTDDNNTASADHTQTDTTGQDHGTEGTDAVEHATDAVEDTVTGATDAVTDTVEDTVEDVVAAVAGDVAAGAKTAKKKCGTCHSFDDGGKNKVGPNLFAIAGAPKAAKEGFKYSKTLKELGGTWTDAELSAFIANPKAFAKGTKMSFAGLKKEKELADVMAYIKTLH